MFSTVLGILCGVFIAADYFGFHQMNGFGYFMCWVAVIGDAISQDLRVTLKKDNESEGGSE